MPDPDHIPLLDVRSLRAVRVLDGVEAAVLDGVSLRLEAGSVTDLAGASGAGKTTLLLALARLLPGVSCSMRLRGEDSCSVPPELWRTRVAYLPQRPVLLPGTVGDNLRWPWMLTVRRRAHVAAPGDAALREALDGIGLADVALERDIDRVSVGQAARVAWLRTVLTAPDVLLLDEPDAALDDESARLVTAATAAFAGRGGAVLRVRHARTDVDASARLLLTAGRLEVVS